MPDQPIIQLQSWGLETLVSDSRSAFRVKKITDKNFGTSTATPIDIFCLQRPDIQEGEARGKQPILSIWDTDVPHDRVIRYRGIGPSERGRLYLINIADIHAITVPSGAIPVQAHVDEIGTSETWCEANDRSLHYGIQGLHTKNTERKHVEVVKLRLRDKATFIAEISAGA
jgi:hypothetical protein